MLQKTTLHCSSKWTSPSTVFSCLNPELKMDISCLFKNVFIYFGNTYSFTFLSHNTSQLQPPSPPSSPYAQVKEPKHVNREPSADHYGHPDGHRWVSMSPSQLILGNDLHFLAPTILHPLLLWNFWSSTYCVAVWSLSQPFSLIRLALPVVG